MPGLCVLRVVCGVTQDCWGQKSCTIHRDKRSSHTVCPPTTEPPSSYAGKMIRVWKFFRVLGGVYLVTYFPPLLSFIIFIMQLLLGVFLFQWWRWDSGINRKASAFSERGVRFLKQNGCSLKSLHNIFWTFTSLFCLSSSKIYPYLLTQPTCFYCSRTLGCGACSGAWLTAGLTASEKTVFLSQKLSNANSSSARAGLGAYQEWVFFFLA